MAVYDIVITRSEGAAPADGFIDLNKSQYYLSTASALPSSVGNAQAKARANQRYKHLLWSLQKISPFDIVSITAVGTATTAPPTFTIRVSYARSDTELSTADESNAGVFLTGAAAAKRAAARSLLATEVLNLEYFDPTTTAAKDDNVGATAYRYYGPHFDIVTVGQVAATITAAEALVTATLVP